MTTKTIHIATDFSRTPAGRFLTDGPYSGERFRTEFLVPALREADHVVVDLGGVYGYGSSFLEEAFGGLVRKRLFSKGDLLQKMKVESPLPTYVSKVIGYINEARPEK